jgi:hypothetical protein
MSASSSITVLLTASAMLMMLSTGAVATTGASVPLRRRLYNWSNYNNKNKNNNGNDYESFRAAKCLSLAVQPGDDGQQQQQQQDFASSSLVVVEERSFMFYFYRGANYDNTAPFVVDLGSFVGSFSGLYGMENIMSCENLAYTGEIFGSSQYSNVAGNYNLYWGPLCASDGNGVTMGVFGDDQCSQYLPQLSAVLTTYLAEGGEDGTVAYDMQSYDNLILAINSAFKYDVACVAGDWGSNICPTVFSSSLETSACQNMYYNNDDANNNGTGRFLDEEADGAAEEEEYEETGTGVYQMSQDDLSSAQASCYAAVGAATSGLTLYDCLAALGLDVSSSQSKGGMSKGARVFLILASIAVLALAADYVLRRMDRSAVAGTISGVGSGSKGHSSSTASRRSKKSGSTREPLFYDEDEDDVHNSYEGITDEEKERARADQAAAEHQAGADPTTPKKKRKFLGFLRRQ